MCCNPSVDPSELAIRRFRFPSATMDLRTMRTTNLAQACKCHLFASIPIQASLALAEVRGIFKSKMEHQTVKFKVECTHR